jgi:exodeoxyribonuclease V alpha subunit
MVDTRLMHSLLEATPISASVILVGDIFQLPSISPGNVLADIIQSEKYQTFELTEIFRQSKESAIIMNAHRVKEGELPVMEKNDTQNALSEFYFIETFEPLKIMERIVYLCSSRIPEIYNFDSIADIQVLTPMHKGEVGTISLNTQLQKVLNPSGKSLEKYGRFFKEGDKVMHLMNNYEKDVFNGDIGMIHAIDMEEKKVIVAYYGRHVSYDFDDLDELSLAYAVSVHKSQGSEYTAVIVPVTTHHYALLQRNLIYTAITRGKNLVILIGTKKALSIALKNNKPNKRLTGLARKILSLNP